VSFAAKNQTEEKMRKILFVIILFLLVFFLYGEVKNPDKPLKGEWDFKLQKVWQKSVEDDDGEIAIVKYKISLPKS
jgi:hypothetical protein